MIIRFTYYNMSSILIYYIITTCSYVKLSNKQIIIELSLVNIQLLSQYYICIYDFFHGEGGDFNRHIQYTHMTCIQTIIYMLYFVQNVVFEGGGV